MSITQTLEAATNHLVDDAVSSCSKQTSLAVLTSSIFLSNVIDLYGWIQSLLFIVVVTFVVFQLSVCPVVSPQAYGKTFG